MKNKFCLIISALFIGLSTFAQVPQSFKYQAVVRGNTGNVLVNQLVSFQLSILKDNPNGVIVYSERQNLSTNSYGIVNINVGNGTIISGDFTTIAWGDFSHFIKVEFDAAGGNNFQFMGTSQILSVPYALYAESAGSAANDNDTNPTNEIQSLSLNNNTLSLTNGGQVTLDSYLDNTDNQSLALNNEQLSISNGNTVSLTSLMDNTDNQTLTFTNNQLSISNGNNVSLAPLIDNTDSQTLSLTGNNLLTISGGNSIQLSSGLSDADADPTNELQALSLLNNTISISDGNSITLLQDNDTSSTNEIQTLSLNSNTLSISGSNSIAIDGDNTNELQVLSLSGDTLFLSQGNYAVFPQDNDVDSLNELQTISISNDTLQLSNNGGDVFLGQNYGMPAGTITSFGGATIPNGWLLCDGALIDRIQYQTLFNVIGVAWGNGNGTTTFNLPDLRGAFLRGVAGSSTRDPDKTTRTAMNTGGNSGNNVGSYQADELESHYHSIIGNNGINAGGTSHGGTSGTFNSGATGGNETRPKNAYVFYIIKY